MSASEVLAPPVVTEAAPAKINLALHITGRRDDGYHLIDTLAVFTEVGDRITLAPAETDSFTPFGPFSPGLPVDGTNLVLRARDAFFEKFGRRIPLAIRLFKQLPISSGMGGGSSDAAALLRGLAQQVHPAASLGELAEIGLKLGADVPMCLYRRPLRSGGIGERVAPVPAFPALPILLVNPGTAISTPAVFKALQGKSNPPLPPLPPKPDFAAVCDWLRGTRNDLQQPASTLTSSVTAALDAIHASGAAFVRMSGSGATCFGLFPTSGEAHRAAEAIRREEPSWWVCPTCTMPSPGISA